IAVPAATVLDVDAEFRPLGCCRRSRAGKTRECDESGDTGLDDEIGHCCLQIGPEPAPFEFSRLPGLETRYGASPEHFPKLPFTGHSSESRGKMQDHIPSMRAIA